MATLGYYILADGDNGLANKWNGCWTGRRSIKSLDDFLNAPDTQEFIIREAMRQHWRLIRRHHLDELVGTKARGVLLTESTLLAIAHLMGDESVAGLAPTKKADDAHSFISISTLSGFQTPYDLSPSHDWAQEAMQRYLLTGETPTLNEEINSIARDMVENYVWCTQGDNRVRPEHAAREGETFRECSSPAPGEDENCRCFNENCLSDACSVHKAHQEALQKAADYLLRRAKENPKSIKQCATYVGDAIRNKDGGNLGLSKISGHGYAKDYGPALIQAGYTQVVAVEKTVGFPPTSGYTPQTGDVAIIQAIEGHIAGHMEMYTQQGWTSDFVQSKFWPSGSYATDKPSYIIYRLY